MMNRGIKISPLLVLTILLSFLLIPPKVSGKQSYSTAKEAIDGARNLYSRSSQMPIVVIVRGVHERGYRTYIDSSYLRRQSLVIEIPTYVGRGDDIYCATLDHLRGLKGRGNRILNTLKKIQNEIGNIDASIFHSGAVVALNNVAGSNSFNEVFQKGKMGKVALAGAYAGPKLSRAMNTSGIPWHSFASKNDLIVNITKTNLQSLGLSGEFRLTPLQLLLAPMRPAAFVLGGALKVPHLALFHSGLKNHPLSSYKGDITSWLADPDKYERGKRSKKKKRKEGKGRAFSDNGGGGGPDGDDNGGNSGDAGNRGNNQLDSISKLTKNGKLNLNIKAQRNGSLLVEMQKNTSEPLNFIIPNATLLNTTSGAQSMGM